MKRSNNQTQFMDLNLDVQLSILEKLNLEDLLSIAATNRHLLSLATFVFKRNHLDKKIYIYDPHTNKGNDRLDGYDMFVQNAETISKILKYFGTSIDHLKVSYTWDPARLMNKAMSTVFNSILHLISLHCSDTLVNFHIDNAYGSFFTEMTRPFKRVERLTIQGKFKELGSSRLAFNEFFPALRFMHLQSLELENKSSLHQYFPHLDHLSIQIFRIGDPILLSEADFHKILQKNPQIRSVDLNEGNRNVLKTMSELLPNLERLELDNYSSPRYSYEEEITFKNVKILKIFSTFSRVPKNITFGNLVQLHTEAFAGNIEWIQDLLKENKNLKQINIQTGCVGNEALETLIPAESNLNEISLRFCEDVKGHSIVQFVRINQRIKRFRFGMYAILQSLKNVGQSLQHEFADNSIINVRQYDISIEPRY